MVNRREFLGITAGAGATLAFTPNLLHAFQESGGAIQKPSGKLLQRAVPSSGEMLPVIGLGRGWAQSLDRAELKETVKTLVNEGGRLIDTVHGDLSVQQLVGTIASELELQSKIFWSTGLIVNGPPGKAGSPSKPDPADVKAQVETLFTTFKVQKIDLIQVLAQAHIPTHLGVLNELKKEGRVRYIGVTDLALPQDMKTSTPPFADLESIMRNESIDFVGMDYSAGDRRAEQTILPLAQERKIGVLAYFPFDRNRIFKRAGTQPLPDWAAEFDAKTWAQFFLKYVISHPAVTVARASTSKASHMLENIGGGIGRLPDEATRKRMAKLVDSLPTGSGSK